MTKSKSQIIVDDLKYGAGAIPSFYNDNTHFTGLGLWSKYLVIHKEDNSYLLNGTSEEPNNWAIEPFSDMSCGSQQSWINCNNGYYIYSHRNGGIYPLLSHTAFINTYIGQELSIKVREDFTDINDAYIDKVFPVYYPKKKYMMFYMPMLQGNGCNYCYIYNFITKSWWKRIVKQNVTIAFRYDDNIYIGTADGKVVREFVGYSFDGEPIEFSWKSPWFTYGDGTNYLSSREFRVKISEEFSNNFEVRNRRDGYDEYKSRTVTNKKPLFQALIWNNEDGTMNDTVWDQYEWVEAGYLIKRFPLENQFFTTQQIEFHGNTDSETMCLLGFEIDRVELEDTPW